MSASTHQSLPAYESVFTPRVCQPKDTPASSLLYLLLWPITLTLSPQRPHPDSGNTVPTAGSSAIWVHPPEARACQHPRAKDPLPAQARFAPPAASQLPSALPSTPPFLLFFRAIFRSAFRPLFPCASAAAFHPGLRTASPRAPWIPLLPHDPPIPSSSASLFSLPNAKKEEPFWFFLYGIRQRPILPGRVQPSTFGTEGLNCCVRDGNRWNPFVIATGNGELFSCRAFFVSLASFPSRPRPLASRLSHCSTLSLPCQVRFSLPLTSPLLRAPLLPAP